MDDTLEEWFRREILPHEAALVRFLARKWTRQADWTNQDPRITAELARWKRSAVPFNLIYRPGKSQPVVLPSILTPDTVLNALSP